MVFLISSLTREYLKYRFEILKYYEVFEFEKSKGFEKSLNRYYFKDNYFWAMNERSLKTWKSCSLVYREHEI